MTFNSPVSVQKIDQIISILNLHGASRVIDVGCGEGELLARIHQAWNADCLGVDIDKLSIELAQNKLKKEIQGEKLRYTLADIKKYQVPKNSFDLAICIGSTHAFDEGKLAYPGALQKMSDLVKPKGLILIGDGYWKQKPEQEYLEFLGDPAGIYNSHEQNIQQAESFGLIPMYTATSNQDEWDHFEWCHLMKAEQKAMLEPENDVARNKVDNIREWNKYYRKFGRSTMGFGFYLYRTPA
jgi:ubiquinone/menaquinone biosynthesis C-methylase UbiE